MTSQDIEIYKQQQDIYKDIHTKPVPLMKNGASLLGSIVKNFSLKPGSGMNSIQCPPSVLKYMSVLELYALLCAPRSYLLQDWTELSAETRFMNVLRWFVEQQMYYPQKGLAQLKPYNPIIGEEFRCWWDHNDSVSTCHCEQVKHHPPISAVYMENKRYQFYYQQTQSPNTVFWGSSIMTKLEGDSRFKLVALDEEYTCNDPNVNMRIVLFGTSVLEHCGEMVVECKKTGYSCYLQFPDKSKWSVKGTVYKKDPTDDSDEKGTPVFKIHGHMNGKVFFTNLKTQEEKLLASSDDSPRHPEFEMQVKPVADQEGHESRRVWHHVTNSLVKNDLVEASAAKTAVEEKQRAVRRERPSDWDWDSHHKLKAFDPTGEVIGKGTPTFIYRNVMKPGSSAAKALASQHRRSTSAAEIEDID